MVGSCAAFPESVSSRTTFPPTFWATLRGWQLLSQKKKKSAPWRRQRIIFKKEHNLTFLSTTHSTPPPHSLVFPPACSSISLFFPSLSPGCSCTILLTCVSFSVSQAGTPARTPHYEEELCKDLELPLNSEGEMKLASFLPQSSKYVRIKTSGHFAEALS